MKGVILSAGKADSTITQIYGDIPSGLIPLNGRPSIYYIIDELIKSNITDINIAIGYKGATLKKAVDKHYAQKANITYVEVSPSKGPGNSLVDCLRVANTDEALICVGDSLINIENIKADFKSNFVVGSKDFVNPKRWCIVCREDGKVKSFHDKEDQIPCEDALALVGVYFLTNINIPALKDLALSSNSLQLSEVISEASQDDCSIVEVKNWVDVGHIDKYYEAKKNLLQTRFFNSLSFDNLLGTLTKKSKKSEKFIQEISWQVNLPPKIKILFPRITDYNLDPKDAFVTMEYYGYPSLAEVWLFSSFNKEILKGVVNKLFSVLSLFKQQKRHVPFADYNRIYIEKTEQRIEELVQNKFWSDLINQDEIVVNGKTLKNWNKIKSTIFEKVNDLYNPNHNCLMHGDYCLSNILYDVNSGLVRLIDPRGGWGKGTYGDIKYDLAKLRHSIGGLYEFVVHDLFDVTIEGNVINYNINSESKHSQVKDHFDQVIGQHYDINQVKMIEGLLFLSMIPLHGDSRDRQTVMFAKAIEYLHEQFEIKNEEIS